MNSSLLGVGRAKPAPRVPLQLRDFADPLEIVAQTKIGVRH
jgi:hypothetical protein